MIVAFHSIVYLVYYVWNTYISQQQQPIGIPRTDNDRSLSVNNTSKGTHDQEAGDNETTDIQPIMGTNCSPRNHRSNHINSMIGKQAQANYIDERRMIILNSLEKRGHKL